MKPPYCKTVVRLGSVTLLALSAMMTVAADYESHVVSQSPVGYYRLNETVQPLSNIGAYATNLGSLGASADGTYVSSPVLGFTGPFTGSHAIDLNGLSQYISAPSTPSLDTTNFTFEIWVKPSRVPLFAYAASSVDFEGSGRSGWYLAQDDGSTFGAGSAWVVRIFNRNGAGFGGQVDAPISAADVWVHLIVTYDDTTKLLSMYTNGVLAEAVTGTAGANGLVYVPNQNLSGNDPFTVGARSTLNFLWPGQAAQTAIYGTALSSTRVAAHYAAATSAGAYAAAVTTDAPLLYHNYFWPAPAPVTANSGTMGSAGNGVFLSGSIAAAPGPVPPVYPGYGATNKAAAFIANGGAVRIPALSLNTNTVTISAWVSATNLQQSGAGIVVTPGSGLIISGFPGGGLSLGYHWNNDPITYNWNPVVNNGFPQLPDSDWAFAALVVQPTEANLYIGLTNSGSITFVGVTNYYTHSSQSFANPTLVGTYDGAPAFSFNGAIDEVALWKRALSSGELYTMFASAVDGVPATILTDLVGPAGPAAVGDPLVLSINAGGTPSLVYTWYKDNVAIAATTNTGTFTIATVSLGDAGTYEVTVTNSFGSASSQEVTVTVVNPTLPVIVGQEGFYASRVLYPTGTLHLAVSATGGGLKYQWYRNGAAIASATASSYDVASVTAANAGSYTVVVTNSVGAVTNGPAGITIPTVAPGSYEAAIVSSAPQAWWRLDEAAGVTNLFDGLGRHDGVYTNINGAGSLPTLGVTGALIGNTNKAISFSASGGIGFVPYSPLLNPGKFSVELWVKTTDLTQVACPASASETGEGGWGWLANAGNWNGYSPAGNTVAPLQDYPEYGSAIVSGAWTHLVIAYDDTTIISGTAYPYRYWINGANAGFVWGGDPATTIGAFIIGGTDPAVRAGRFFNGQVDEVAVYSRVLTANEITNHIVARGVELIAPQFTSQPLPQTAAAGKSVTFSASAVGIPAPAYQWYKDGAPIPAATTNSYIIPSVALADAGGYSLRVTNLAGTNFSTTATLVVVPATSYANVTNDLVLHLRFEGDTQDSSGKGNNGTPSSSPAPGFVTGQIGSQAAELTTIVSPFSASYVDLGTPTDLLFGGGTSFSVGLWVKLPADAVPGDVPFIGTEINAANNPGWFVGPSYQAGGWQFNLNDGNNNMGLSGSDNSINNGQWHNLIMTVDRTGAVLRSYLDGLLVATRSIAGLGSIDVGGAITIAQDPTHLYPEAAVFNLDDIGVWRRALTPSEVANIESAGKAGNSFDTVAPAVPLLSISTSGGNVVLTYSGGTLVESTDPTVTKDAWTPVAGASSPWPVTPSGVQRYYSVRQ